MNRIRKINKNNKKNILFKIMYNNKNNNSNNVWIVFKAHIIYRIKIKSKCNKSINLMD